ncbi:MAG: alpha/beta fold hydrolase [Pirellulaceae bacterium]
MPFFEHDQIRFHFREVGQGVPIVFQHGLGGSVEQPFSLFLPPDGFRMIAMDCRGHGQTEPLGNRDKIRIASFADDLQALLDFLRIPRVIMGGISMGAAVALNFALRFPQRTIGLIQSRPAWLAEPNPRNAAWFGEIVRLIRTHGPAAGQTLFRQSSTYRELLTESPDVAQSMLNQFANPRVDATVITLEQIQHDAPCASLTQLADLDVPTLVMANRQDPVHPFEFGQTLAAAIPGAEFVELTAKSVSAEQHRRDVQARLGDFLERHFAVGEMTNDE